MNQCDASKEQRLSISQLTGRAIIAGATRATVTWLLNQLDQLIHSFH